MNCISVLHNNRNAPEQKELDLVSEQVIEKDEVKEKEFRDNWPDSVGLIIELNRLIKGIHNAY